MSYDEVPTDYELEDAELLEYLRRKHVETHRGLSKTVDTKKFARTYGHMEGYIDRARDYVAGDPEDHAVAEYRKIMRYPAAWAAARMQVSDGRPDEASVEEAYRRFCYMESRALIRDGYYVDRIAFEKWSTLTTHVEYDPVVPGSSDHRI